MTLPVIQKQVLRQLESGPLTDKVIAGKLQTTLHGARASLNALRIKGLVKRRKHPDGDTYEYRLDA